jgi:N-acetylmuramoyl-L-alanine amidase
MFQRFPIYGIVQAATLAFALTAVPAHASDTAYSQNFNKARQAFDLLSRDSTSTRHQWLRLIESFQAIHRIAKDRRIRLGSLRYAGRASLGLYHCSRRPEDLERAVRIFRKYNRIANPVHATRTRSSWSNEHLIWASKAATGAGSSKSSSVRTGSRLAKPRARIPNITIGSTALDYILPRRNNQNIISTVKTRFPSAPIRTGNPYIPVQAKAMRGTEHWREKVNAILPERQRADVFGTSDEDPAPNSADSKKPIAQSANASPKISHGENSAIEGSHATGLGPKVPSQIRTAALLPNTVVAPPGISRSKNGSSKKLVVVIDPGHGGKDSGAVSSDGRLKEKDVTLRLAMRVKRLLNMSNPRIRVVLTRSEDRFLACEERTALANTLNADLFVSIHCNASTDSESSGLETYYLSTTSCKKALEVAARENNIPLDRMSDLQATLLDLTMQSKRNESARLAKTVHRRLVRRMARLLGPDGDRGVKRAPFSVLLGAKMPSILVECAFISNVGEARRLRDPRHLNMLAEGIARGADSYLKRL